MRTLTAMPSPRTRIGFATATVLLGITVPWLLAEGVHSLASGDLARTSGPVLSG